jgi:hypothetical protein
MPVASRTSFRRPRVASIAASLLLAGAAGAQAQAQAQAQASAPPGSPGPLGPVSVAATPTPLPPAWAATSSDANAPPDDDTGSTVAPGVFVARILLGVGLVGGSYIFDQPFDDYAARHKGSPVSKALAGAGEVLPFAGLALVSGDWLYAHGSRQGDVAFAALEASTTAVVTGELLKLSIDRNRPDANGPGGQSSTGSTRSESSFPSLHTTLAWALVTPYAQEYDAPWLYGLAATVNLGRVASRDHWFSDTVAGAMIGYAWGDFFHHRLDNVRVAVGPRTVYLQMAF